MTMNMSWKINILLQIETCEDFIEFVVRVDGLTRSEYMN